MGDSVQLCLGPLSAGNRLLQSWGGAGERGDTMTPFPTCVIALKSAEETLDGFLPPPSLTPGRGWEGGGGKALQHHG